MMLQTILFIERVAKKTEKVEEVDNLFPTEKGSDLVKMERTTNPSRATMLIIVSSDFFL